MRRFRARHNASARPGRSALTSEVGWFVVIGVASTVGQALLYWVMRHWSPPVLANLASLLVVTVLNTEANRRLTFRGSPVRAVQAHLAAGGLFVLAYVITSGAVLLFRHYRPTASPAAETLVLAPAFALVTVVRFIVLRLVVFRRRNR
ncbi:GtrA family protein [Streptomyces sp. RB6PN25]|uniref:GtrA family protein n=1 Tax=Streptomyces humicola TaxID=2953240 RepID=A0ABT1PXQ1_9ACTN|nr:GtrA family protein [Streptomyces humicola]MCQ4082453.1 GtrA family protein [Streptomyces humicola]